MQKSVKTVISWVFLEQSNYGPNVAGMTSGLLLPRRRTISWFCCHHQYHYSETATESILFYLYLKLGNNNQGFHGCLRNLKVGPEVEPQVQDAFTNTHKNNCMVLFIFLIVSRKTIVKNDAKFQRKQQKRVYFIYTWNQVKYSLLKCFHTIDCIERVLSSSDGQNRDTGFIFGFDLVE